MRLNHSIVSKIYVALKQQQKRHSAPSAYHTWNPSTKALEDLPKSQGTQNGTSEKKEEPTSNAYSIWKPPAPDKTTSTPPPNHTMSPPQQSTASSVYSTFSETTSSPYATWNEKNK